MKKKIPWGFFAGICAVFVFYLTAASVAVFIVLDRIEAETNGHASLFGTWYQALMFVLDIVFAVGLVAFIVLSVRRGKNKDKRTEEIVGQGGELR